MFKPSLIVRWQYILLFFSLPLNLLNDKDDRQSMRADNEELIKQKSETKILNLTLNTFGLQNIVSFKTGAKYHLWIIELEPHGIAYTIQAKIWVKVSSAIFSGEEEKLIYVCSLFVWMWLNLKILRRFSSVQWLQSVLWHPCSLV